jgi:DNA repair exonuclease SbcCD ATPase subunit
MKKVFVLLLGAGVLFSCTNMGKKVTESEEYQKLLAERDSLQAVLKTSDAETQEMMAVISEVEANFDKIREAEKYISTQSEQSGEMNQDTKKRVSDNFQMIQEILKRNKAQLAELNRKYASSNKQVASLQGTIDRLNREMQESSARMVVLQGELAKRDATIAQLSGDISELAQHAEEQSSTIKEQDKSLHTAYYVFGTAVELKEQKILSGGFLKSTKVMQDTFNKDYFLQIDIREVTEIPLYAPKAKLWSTHPEGTYEFVKGTNDNLTFQITDTQRFWSLTKYLIIEVN